MTSELCILTAKDFAALVVMRDCCFGRDDPLLPILKRKLESVRIVFPHDVPANVATMFSRIAFRLDGGASDTRILSPEGAALPMGMYLPISTLRGLALLGLAEGQEFRLTNLNGDEERIILEKVLYQPEAAKHAGRPLLKLVSNAGSNDNARAVAFRRGGVDDPGPSVA